MAHLHPLAFNGARFSLAGAMLFLFLRRRGPVRWPPQEDLPAVIFLGMIGHTVYQLVFIYGLDLTLAGNAAIILASTPIWALIISAVSGKGESTPTLWKAAAIGLVGIVLVIAGGAREISLGANQTKGDLLIAAGAFFWALYTVAGKDLLARHGSLQVTAWALWVGAAPLLLLAIPPALETSWQPLPPAVWGGILYAGVGSLAIAYVLWYGAVKELGSSRTALWSNMVPAVALVTAWVLLGEIPSKSQLAGAALIVVSVALSRRRGPTRLDAYSESPGRSDF